MAGISCWHSDCEAVGSARAGPAGRNLILTITRGKPGTLSTPTAITGSSSVSCVSAATCYAAGGAALYTVTNGVAADQQTIRRRRTTELGRDRVHWQCVRSRRSGVRAGSARRRAGEPVRRDRGPAHPRTDSRGFSGIAMRAGSRIHRHRRRVQHRHRGHHRLDSLRHQPARSPMPASGCPAGTA